jgi:hypothetical protein
MEKATLIDRWHGYLAAFNSHCLLDLKEFYHPNLKVIIDGAIIGSNRDSMMVFYADVWRKMGTLKVEPLDIKPTEHGLQVLLRIPSDKKDVTIDYLYDDKGLQIAHIIDSRLDKDIVS